MDKSVLIIDDDDMVRETLARGLRDAGFSALTADGVPHAREILSRVRVDAIILDRMMSDVDGITFLQGIRASGDTTPVIMLTAMNGPMDAISGLDAGANDYLAKPFQLRELILRLNNIIRRDSGATKMPDGLTFSDNEFFAAHDGGMRPLSLSDTEKQLLIHLTRPVGNVVAASPMVAKRLRGKINGVLSNIDIITIRGLGYKLVCL